MERIRFEKVGDVTVTYPYLEVFLVETDFLFLEIAITDAKTLSFTFYSNKIDTILSWEEWNSIHLQAGLFLQRELQNEEDFQKFLTHNT